MELKAWKIEYLPGWDEFFKKFDKPIREQILKKFDQMEQPLSARSLHSSNRVQIEEVGQCRIAFIQDEKIRTKIIYFVGNHKQYENWYKKQLL